jgi:hypothetical protein
MLLQLGGSQHAWLEGTGPLADPAAGGGDAIGTAPTPYSRNRRTPEAICLCFRASSDIGVCLWLSFCPGSNQGFGVPAAQPESAYRPVDLGLDLGGVLCIKELRRGAKYTTVRYHRRTL